MALRVFLFRAWKDWTIDRPDPGDDETNTIEERGIKQRERKNKEYG
jgi:hypothetical protein